MLDVTVMKYSRTVLVQLRWRHANVSPEVLLEEMLAKIGKTITCYDDMRSA
jgi:hypothetical protein